MPVVNTDGDSTEEVTILGAKRVNPYTVTNMVQAYNNLGLTNVVVTANNQYVRFLPSSAVQLSVLDSVMEAQNLELFDAPMDYDVVKEANYYQDPSIPDTMVTWQYAVVPTTFQAPAGITYQVLSQIHIPTDTYVAVETEAERLASIQDSIACSGGGALSIAPVPNVPQCGTGYHWNYTTGQCVCDCCPTGYQWNGTQCVPNVTPPPPPSPSPDQQVPGGNITVDDNNLFTTPGVRNVRIVAKRWFKIERSYTDNTGHFLFTKRFKHKVKIVVKFKNSYCNIRSIRGIRLWQSLYVVRKTIGVYGADKSNIIYNFGRYPISANARTNGFWVAATTINAVQEHRDYSTTYGFTAAPLNLNIYISNLSSGLASTPLFGKRYANNISSAYANTFLVNHTANELLLAAFYASFFATIPGAARLDMAIGYNRSPIARFTSDYIKETEYHELSHASHYAILGTVWYTNFVSAEVAEIAIHPLTSDPLNPYGTGNTANSPIIALGEAWAYHMGHFLADQQYGTLGSCQGEQKGGFSYCPGGGAHPHIDVLEAFNPNLTTDPFRWIPKGLMEDMIDNTINETIVNDQVSGFSIAQIFGALQSDVTSVTQYKTRFLLQNNYAQQIQINNLFTSYHY